MKLSVITINYNNASGLKKTLASVFAQTLTNFEYIVIDGGSTDSSKQFIEANSDNLTYWVSEPDAGIYNAMNKGIKAASGEFLLFLNSGDCFNEDKALSKLYLQSAGFDIIYGDLMLNNGEKLTPLRYPDTLTFDYFFIQGRSLPHQATLIRKSLFGITGLYNEQNKIVSDWEFFIIGINKYNFRYKHVEEFIAVFNLSGISMELGNYEMIEQERQAVIDKHFSTFVKDYLTYANNAGRLQKIINTSYFKIINKVCSILNFKKL